ncbi:MAG: MFS transporter [Bryobacterales bacterium]|nr:MFS transporter [Bryobacterales bacterium]
MTEILRDERGRWLIRIFAITWLAYASYYLCRKNLSVLMPLFSGELGYTSADLAQVVFAYSLAYALGQFLMGTLADRFGPRWVVTLGMLASAAATALIGVWEGLTMLILLQAVNGLAQSCGWSGLVKVMACWFDYRHRGFAMGLWTTNYVLGGFLATVFVTFVATNTLLAPTLGWRRGVWVPALGLAAVAAAFALIVRNRPVDVGLPAVEEREQAAPRRRAPFRTVMTNPVVLVIAAAYFCLKLTRYALLFWLPLYMTQRLRYSPAEAGYTSSVFELVGFLGAILAGYVSDRFLSSRRFPVAAVMLAGLAAACFFFPALGALGRWGNILGIALIGILTFGPDTLLGGAATQDAGTQEAAATAAGFVNGVGSLGSVLSPFAVAWVAGTTGWDNLFYLFSLISLFGAVIVALKWNHGVPLTETSPVSAQPICQTDART